MASDDDGTLAVVAYRKVMWRIMPLLFICYVVAYLDRINISFAKLQMLDDTGLSEMSYAVGASLFFWSYMIFEVPANLILRRVGARRWIARIMVTWGIVSIVTMFCVPLARATGTSTVTVFYALRLLLGVCEAGFLPGAIYYVSTWVPASQQSRTYAIFLTSLPVCLILGGPLSGWILHASMGLGGLHGWQWLFLVEGLPSILMGVIVLLALPDDVHAVRWLNETEKEALVGSLKQKDAAKVSSMFRAIGDSRVWLLVLILLCINIGFYGLSFWLPTIIHKAGIQDSTTVGLLSAIPWLFAIPCLLGNAAHSRRSRERRLHASVPALIGGLAFICSALSASHLVFSLAFLALAIGSLLAIFPIFWTFPNQMLEGAAAAGGLALINALSQLSGVIGAMASAVVGRVTGDLNNASYLFGCSAILGGLLLLALPRSSTAYHAESISARPKSGPGAEELSSSI